MSAPDPIPPVAAPPRWADLAPRVMSAVVMIAIGGSAIWAGGLSFVALALVASGLMTWELARITAAAPPQGEGKPSTDWSAVMLALLAVAVLLLNITAVTPWPAAFLLLPSLIGLLTPRRDNWAWGLYSLVILASGLALVMLRVSLGLPAVICLVATVIVSDVAGYFAGRIIGGPKFWPRFSPKKTWSGTVAGWIGAALVGVVFAVYGYGDARLIWILPLIAFAGQLGDIAESAIKRRAGVKDASNLIPGHGGLMDRFDALAFAAILALVLQLVVPFLPYVKG